MLLTEKLRRFLGRAIRNPNLKYVEGTYDTERETLTNIGMSRDVADSMVELMEFINCGKYTEQAERTAKTTTPTTIEDFSKI